VNIYNYKMSKVYL